MSQDSANVEVGHEEKKVPAAKPVILGLIAVFIIYAILAFKGLPQQWGDAQLPHETPAAVEQAAAPAEVPAVDKAAADKATADKATADKATADKAAAPVSDKAVEKAPVAEEHHEKSQPPAIWMIIPFCLLLLCIAILPLIPATEHWWESNLNRFLVAAVLGLITLAYYAFFFPGALDLHWPTHHVVSASAGPIAKGGTIFVNAIVADFIPFIILLFALFTISGGIRISGDLKASPMVNAVIIFIGAVLASFIGTTGAAMLLIRLLLETNKERKYKAHTVIFFIFCVCNCGGCLLPIGDPPLFLGYLKGVAFAWTMNLWREWLFVNGLVVVVYLLVDYFWYYRKETDLNKALDNVERKPLKFEGLFPNVFCLAGVICAVAFLAPGQKIGDFNPWMFLREIVQLLMVVISLSFGSRAVRVENKFNYSAIMEVAALFFGIFICMQAPLQILNVNGGTIADTVDKYGQKICLNQEKQFYWMTGCLSSVLDNAPTYVVFFETAKASAEAQIAEAKEKGDKEKADKMEKELNDAEKACGVRIPIGLLTAVSIGAVFMGSMTYIGNGPNFMVKAIAEESGVKMPSFFGYMVYSILILLPVFIIMTILFM